MLETTKVSRVPSAVYCSPAACGKPFAGGAFAEGGIEVGMCRLRVVWDENQGTKVETSEP